MKKKIIIEREIEVPEGKELVSYTYDLAIHPKYEDILKVGDIYYGECGSNEKFMGIYGYDLPGTSLFTTDNGTGTWQFVNKMHGFIISKQRKATDSEVDIFNTILHGNGISYDCINHKMIKWIPNYNEPFFFANYNIYTGKFETCSSQWLGNKENMSICKIYGSEKVCNNRCKELNKKIS